MPFVAGESAGAVELYYEESGDGVPVVLVGGLTSTVELWVHQVPALAERHRVRRDIHVHDGEPGRRVRDVRCTRRPHGQRPLRHVQRWRLRRRWHEVQVPFVPVGARRHVQGLPDGLQRRR